VTVHHRDHERDQFDEIVQDLKIENKAYKIVADQAANVKNAFAEVEEAEDPIIIATTLARRQQKIDLIKENKEREKETQAENLIIQSNRVSISRVYPCVTKRTKDKD
jgi:hypothetical protein